MATPIGRPIDQPTKALVDALARDRKDIEQIKRELVKIPKPATPTTGGIAGASRCEAFSFATQVASGQSGDGVTSWGITSIFGTAGAGVTAGTGTYPSLVVAEAGWYSYTASWEMGWNTTEGTPPTYFSVAAPYSSNPEAGFYEPGTEFAPAPKPPNHEVKAWLAVGPILLPAGGTIDLNATWNNTTPGNNRSAHVDLIRWA